MAINTIELKKELVELSKKIEQELQLQIVSDFSPSIELSDDVSLPFNFRAKVFAPGKFLGYSFRTEDIKRNMMSIFKQQDNIANNELNLDHKNNRKMESSVLDLVGKVTNVIYNDMEDVLFMDCSVSNRNIADSIRHGDLKYVSLRIQPLKVEEINGETYAIDFDFEELSLVRAPGFKDAKIISHS